MKTKEELLALKAEVEEMKNKLAGLSVEKMKAVTEEWAPTDLLPRILERLQERKESFIQKVKKAEEKISEESSDDITALKAEVAELNKKLAELTEDELILVSGGNLNIFLTAYINNNECVRCGDCITACPVNAIYYDGSNYIIDSHNCVLCTRCYYVCPPNAIRGTTISY